MHSASHNPSRTLESPQKIVGLDVLRTLAICLVFLWHYRRFGSPEWLEGLARFGWSGVDLFFVLSGYLIASPLLVKLKEKKSLSIKTFYLRRVFRTVPVYFFVLALYVLFPAFTEKEGMAPLWKFFSFTMNFGLDYQNAGSFSHAWSLCVEEQFYLLFPMVLLLGQNWSLKNKTFLVFLLLIAGGFLLRAYSWKTYVAPVYSEPEQLNLISKAYATFVYYPSYNRLDGLLCGIIVAWLSVFYPALKERLLKRSNLLFVIGLLLLSLTYMIGTEPFSYLNALLSYPLVSVGYGLLVFASLRPDFFLNKLPARFFGYFAAISYSFYLIHKQLNKMVQELIAGYSLSPSSSFLICFAVAVLGGTVLFLLIEKPFLLLRQKITDKKN